MAASNPWLDVTNAAPIDTCIVKLKEALITYNGRGMSAAHCRQQLFPESFLQLLDRITGEHSDVAKGLSCWLDTCDFSRGPRYNELLNQIRAAAEAAAKGGADAAEAKAAQATAERTLASEFPDYEQVRVQCANALVETLLKLLSFPRPGDSPDAVSRGRAAREALQAAQDSIASLGSMVQPGPKAGAPTVQPVLFRSELLPACTQRLLTASNWADPANLSYDGGLPADPLLPILKQRAREGYGASLLPGPHAGAAEVSALTADRTGLRLAPRDALVLYLVRYRVSRTRRSEGGMPAAQAPGTGSAAGMSSSTPRDRHYATYAYRPLSSTSLDQLLADRPYLAWLWDSIDVALPPTQAAVMQGVTGAAGLALTARPGMGSGAVFPPNNVPDAELLLAAVLAYWLTQNHPYAVVPLPGQSAATAAAVPPQRSAAAAAALSISGPLSPSGGLRGTFGPANARRGMQDWRPRTAEATAWSAAVASAAPAAAKPADALTDASTYAPVTIDGCEAVHLLLIALLCNSSLPGVMSGRDSLADGSPHPLGREQPEAGGPSLLRLASDTLRRGPGDVSLEHASGVNQLLLRLSQTEVGRRFITDSGGRAGSGVTTVPRELRDIIAGPLRMPDLLARMHAPLFHWLRVHVASADLTSDPLAFAAVVDVWLSVLTPWRARLAYKNALPDATSTRASRYVDYSVLAGRALASKVQRLHDGMGQRGQGQGQTATSSAGQSATVPLSDLMADVRSSPQYQAVLQSCGDFQSRLAAVEGAALDLDPQHCKADTWAPWIRLHYAFYTHLLHVFLTRMRQANFAGDQWTRPGVPGWATPLVYGQANGTGPSSSPAPHGPVLLELLERVLDVYEPSVVSILRAAEVEVDSLFPRPGAGAASGGPQGSPMSHASTRASTAMHAGYTGQPERMGARVQLLAHVGMLQLPPEVRPAYVLPALSTVAEEAGNVVRRLQAALDSSSLGDAQAPSATLEPDLHIVRLPDVPVPPGWTVNGVTNLGPWQAARQEWSEALTFLLTPVLAPVAVLLYLVGVSSGDYGAWVGLAVGLVLGHAQSLARSLGVAGQDVAGLLDNAFGGAGGASGGSGAGASASGARGALVGAGDAPSTTPVAKPSAYRLGDRLQLAIDRCHLLFADPSVAPSSLPVPPSLRLQRRAQSWVRSARRQAWAVLDWWLLRADSTYSHDAQEARRKSGLAEGREDAASVASEAVVPQGAWESRLLMAITGKASEGLRELTLAVWALIMAVRYGLQLAASKAAGTAAPGPLYSPRAEDLPGPLRADFLRLYLRLADVRILPMWAAWAAVAYALSSPTAATVVFVALFAVLRLYAA